MSEESPTPETGDDATVTSIFDALPKAEEPEVSETDEVENNSEESEDQLEDDSEESEEITLDDLAVYTGLEPDRLDVNDEGEVLVKVKVDGQESSVPFKEVIANYQRADHLAKETKETVELKKSLKSQHAEAQAKLQEKLQQAEDLISLAAQDLQSEFQSVNWKELEEEDKGEFAALQLKFQQREKTLVDRYNAIQAERQANQPDLKQAHAELGQRLVEAIPEWSDLTVARKELEEIQTYALDHGYTAEKVQSIVNHEDYLLLRKAMLYDKLQTDKPEITNVVRKAKKIVKPGMKPTKKPKPKTAEEIMYGT